MGCREREREEKSGKSRVNMSDKIYSYVQFKLDIHKNKGREELGKKYVARGLLRLSKTMRRSFVTLFQVVRTPCTVAFRTENLR